MISNRKFAPICSVLLTLLTRFSFVFENLNWFGSKLRYVFGLISHRYCIYRLTPYPRLKYQNTPTETPSSFLNKVLKESSRFTWRKMYIPNLPFTSAYSSTSPKFYVTDRSYINCDVNRLTSDRPIQLDNSIVINVESVETPMNNISLPSGEDGNHKRLSDSGSSDNSEDLVVFTVYEKECLEADFQDSAESSESDNVTGESSDEGGWTSDCEQLCAQLYEKQIINSDHRRITENLSNITYQEKANSEKIDSRYFEGVNLFFMTKAVRELDSGESTSDEDQPKELECGGCPKSAVQSTTSYDDEHDSGISSGNSNPSDSSTCDEDPNSSKNHPTSHVQAKSSAVTYQSSGSNCHRKLTRGSPQSPLISVRQLKITIPSLVSCELINGGELTSPPDIFESLSSQESDWESDTESEDAETHYPSRSSQSKIKAAASAAPSSAISPPSLSGALLLSANGTADGNELIQCFCSADTILKCSFCVDSRKRLLKASHQRTVHFPSTSEKLETTHFLEETDDENQADSFANCSRNNSPSKSGTIYSPPQPSGSSRKSPWEMMARDRVRFQRRIFLTDNKISYVLLPQHRSQVFTSRFADTTIISISQQPFQESM